ETDLAEGGRLLVAEVARHRDPAQLPHRLAEHLRGGTDLGEHRPGHPHRRQDLLVPVQGGEVHGHGAAGVGDVGDVEAAVDAAGQVPDDPRVDVPEGEVAGLGPGGDAVLVLEDPADLRAGEV